MDMISEVRYYARQFFALCMMELRRRGLSREYAKQLIRNSGLIEKCRSYDGACYVLHYNVEEWCDYLMNDYQWPDNSKPNKFDKYYA